MTLYKVTTADLKSSHTSQNLSIQYKVGEFVEVEAKNSGLFYYTVKPNHVYHEHILWECEVEEPSSRIVLTTPALDSTVQQIDSLWGYWLNHWRDNYPKIQRFNGVIVGEYPIWLIDTKKLKFVGDIGIAKRIKLIREVT